MARKKNEHYVARHVGLSPSEAFSRYKDPYYNPTEFDSCVFVICPRNHRQRKHSEWQAQISYAKQHFPRKCRIVIADTLQAHNLLSYGETERWEEAREKAKKSGEEWLKECLPFVEQLSEPAKLDPATFSFDSPAGATAFYLKLFEAEQKRWFSKETDLIMWDDLVQATDTASARLVNPHFTFSEIHARICRVYDSDPAYSNAMNQTVEKRLDALNKRGKQLVPEARGHTLHYLIEEMAGIEALYQLIWFLQGHKGPCPVECYPGDPYDGYPELATGFFKYGDIGIPLTAPVLHSLELEPSLPPPGRERE